MSLQTSFRCIAWLLTLAITIFSLSPIELRPVTGISEFSSNMERFAALVPVGAAFCLGYPRRRIGTLIMVLAIIGFLEAAQAFVPGRHGHFADSLVKAAGALLGGALVMLLEYRKRLS